MKVQGDCPACLGSTLRRFFALENVPVYCNVLLSTTDAARRVERGDIHLGLCDACGLIFNTAFEPEAVSYSPQYENSLHFSPHFQRYAQDLAARLVADHQLRGKDVIEIGAGKGDFLAMLCSAGVGRGRGFDVSYDPDQSPLPPGLDVSIVRRDFSAAGEHDAADLICCRHVLEHIPQPRDFLEQVRIVASRRPGSVVFFEVPDVMYTLRDLGIWDIIYEHCSYFCPTSLSALFRSAGFRVERCSSAYANQFLCLEATPDERATDRVRPADGELEALRLTADRFAAHHANKVRKWEAELAGLAGQGRRVALWGAGSKGVTFLNTVEAAAGIHHVVDLNPRKQGRFVPGTGHRIDTPQALEGSGVQDVLVMNPVYRQEIEKQLHTIGVRATMHLV